MAKLKAKTRNALKASKFGLPGAKGKGKAKGKYPIEDKGHAVAAESRASEEEAKGNLSPERASKIKHRARAVLGETDSTYHRPTSN